MEKITKIICNITKYVIYQRILAYRHQMLLPSWIVAPQPNIEIQALLKTIDVDFGIRWSACNSSKKCYITK